MVVGLRQKTLNGQIFYLSLRDGWKVGTKLLLIFSFDNLVEFALSREQVNHTKSWIVLIMMFFVLIMAAPYLPSGNVTGCCSFEGEII